MTRPDVDRIALSRLSALAHDGGLSILRTLLASYPASIPAGQLASLHAISANALSFHLKEMAHAGLVVSERDGRFILYRAEPDALAELTQFLEALQQVVSVEG